MSQKRTRHRPTNPECTAGRHSPTMASWRRGCQCETARAAMVTWAKENASDSCRGKTHSDTEAAWNAGCRCVGALIAHEEHKIRIRGIRQAAVEHYKRTGECGATRHSPTDYSFLHGCRCPRTVKAVMDRHGESLRRLRRDVEPIENPWRQGRMLVDRNNLFLLLHGLVDRPTHGERLAATAILQQRGGPAGFYQADEIAQRIGVDSRDIFRYRRKLAALREERIQRRLTDARVKARHAAAAAGRKERVRTEHEAARRRKEQPCSTR